MLYVGELIVYKAILQYWTCYAKNTEVFLCTTILVVHGCTEPCIIEYPYTTVTIMGPFILNGVFIIILVYNNIVWIILWKQ